MMLWERLEIALTPRLIVMRRGPLYRLFHSGIRTCLEAIEQVEDSTDWRAAVAALEKMLVRESRPGTRVHIALSDLWVRSHVIPAASADLNEDEMLLLARTHFARQYPETGHDHWTFRLARQGTRLLIAGTESELLGALRNINSNAGTQAKVSRIEPLFTWVYDRYEKPLVDAHGWMLLEEPGMLSVAFLEKGQLTSFHCQRCEGERDAIAVRLLERQSALLAQQRVEVRIFSVHAHAIHLPAPWRVVWHQSIFEADDTAAVMRSRAPILQQH